MGLQLGKDGNGSSCCLLKLFYFSAPLAVTGNLQRADVVLCVMFFHKFPQLFIRSHYREFESGELVAGTAIDMGA